ncbi:unnamed protein product [Adineta steineri]|uniref:Uncharacterized protein n=1 Tax=Adineta steineri TaxID=433720 RepID=A0A819GVQ3_9BILA|nr:unnamed protein product [Adineta steineri]CAF3885863.1 unnamed protein product [Adineta steineri]
MQWSNIFIVVLLVQSLLIIDIDGNASRRRQRRQRGDTSGSLYGTNSNLGASAPAGYNYPSNTNIQGIRMNNADARDNMGNPLISSQYADNSLSSVNYYNQPRPQQNQVYGTSDQSSSNSLYPGNNFYSSGGTNQILRDTNGNPLSSGSIGSSFYSSSNTQMAYPPNTNQVLTNKDQYGTSNINTNQYGYNSNPYGGQMNNNNNNLLPNSNTYGGPMNNNNNLIPNSNGYNVQTGNNLVPNSNTYSGYMGVSNTNNRYNPNSANTWYPNKDTNTNNNNYNSYGYSNPNSIYYNNSYQLVTSSLIIFLSFLANMIVQ